jgi:alanine racemase
LGVAYVDEGVELRKSGLELAIMVMNSDRSSWSDCIKYNLEPSVYSFVQMEELVSELILMDIQDFPIHLKFDTGMHRLGFFPNDISKVVSYLKSQPEIKVKSVYSHLADADNLGDNSYTLEQMTKFQFVSETLQKNLPYPVLRHILNTEGLSNFPEYGFDMVRIGIGLYGVSSNPAIAKKLTPVLSWKSTVSQIKTLRVGESVGYSRSFIANVETKIATIPVGYADGFKRILGKGNGGVFIGDNHCLTIGNVCMDMIMVDITNLDIEVGDEVEIIGPNQSVHVLAEKCGTISYEIMTSLSARMPRIFVQEED